MPLFALTIMFSFTTTPKCALRTRKAAASSDRISSSGARRTASASSRASASPASALSASDSQLDVVMAATGLIIQVMGGSLNGRTEQARLRLGQNGESEAPGAREALACFRDLWFMFRERR